MNTLSIIAGFLALIGAMIAFTPFFGWINWFVIPFAILAIGFGILSSENTGQNLGIFVLVVSIFRLSVGGGCI